MGLPVLVEHHNITHGHRPHPTPEGARVLVMTGEKSFEAGALAKHPGIDAGVVGHGDTAFCLLVLSETVVRVQICLIDLVVVRYASLRGIDAAVALHKSGKLQQMIETYQIDAIAVGNGTAGRETEDFLRKQTFRRDIQMFMVSEQGVSVYSASKIARDEFPEYDVTVRGAVSIGRRLMDPLAELVKIDPKSIGVGQYQHDVDQTKLKKSLDQTVESCVNLVGVNVNTAGTPLLTYISGVGPQLAQNIVNYRTENGPFASRKELMKVPRMGAKAFEQCAGFLRIPQAGNPLDNTAVHPESYPVVEQMARDLDCTVSQLIADKEKRKQIDLKRYLSPTVGMPTLTDILAELDKPGRDPRGPIQFFEFDPNIRAITDLREGMELPGIVTNITDFGVFVDIGIKENGLVHRSKLADRYVADPNEVVSIHQHIRVRVIGIDLDRKRIQLQKTED